MATFDYLEGCLAGSFVCDQYDPVTEYYQQQKIQIEKYFKQRTLDRLRQRLASLIEGLQNRADLNFATYIKEKTGYDIDIFEEVRKRVDTIIAQNEIRSQKELNDIGTMLRFYEETLVGGEKVGKLKSLSNNYSKRSYAISHKRNAEYSEDISRVEKDGLEEVTVRISTGTKPKHLEEQVAVSPDGKRRLRVIKWSDGKRSSTSVVIEFPTASGAVYHTSGIRPYVMATWKDNSSIVIVTKKEYISTSRHRQVRSFDDIITIEYIEE